MNDADDGDDSRLPEPLRTVTPPSRTHPDAEMDVIGWLIFIGLLVILTPLIPILAVVWLIARASKALGRR